MYRILASIFLSFCLFTYAFSQDQFVPHIFSDEIDIPWSLLTVDMDDDGDMDVVAAGYNGDLILYELDENLNFASHIISDHATGDITVYAVDLDGDFDLDIVGSTYCTGNLVWWENLGSFFFAEHLITEEYSQFLQIAVADFDHDGDIDLGLPLHEQLGTRGLVIGWNDGDTNFTFENIAPGTMLNGIEAADLDNDSDMDLVASGDIIRWYENCLPDTFIMHEIGPGPSNALDIAVADLDNDDDMDIVTAGYEHTCRVLCFLNNSMEEFSSFILGDFQGITHIALDDINGDNYTDIALSMEGRSLWYVQNNGRGGYYPFEIDVEQGSTALDVADIDQDGDLDLVQGRYEAMTWWENQIPPAAPPGAFHAIAPAANAALAFEDAFPIEFRWYASDPVNPWDVVYYRFELSVVKDGTEYTTSESELNRYDWSVNLSELIGNGAFADPLNATWTVTAYTNGGEINCIEGPIHFRILPPVSVSDQTQQTPTSFELLPVAPNPFNATANIRIALPQSALVELVVMDVLGRHVCTLASGSLQCGEHSFLLDGSNLASGTYLVHARTSLGEQQVQRMILLK